MASGRQPDKRKPATKRAPGGKGARKRPPVGRKPGRKPERPKKTSAPRRIPPLSHLAAWLLAVMLLAGVIHFSRASWRQHHTLALPGTAGDIGGKTAKRTPPDPAPKKAGPPGEPLPRAQASAPAPSAASGHGREKPAQPVRAPLPPGPVVLPPPAFTSEDIPPDPIRRESFSVALNRPAPGDLIPSPPIPSLPPKPVMAQVAVVIDDFGGDIRMARKFLSLPFPVTFSVLPFEKHSGEIAELAHAHGHEVILHCPMEPRGYPANNPGRGAILVAMSDEALRRNLRAALDVSPHFLGMNNHMGSRMTEDAQKMRTVLAELNRRGLFFIDSWTSPNSKAWSVARELKVPTRKRDIFLDHNPSVDAVRNQIAKLIRTAKVQGTALAIGHPREATLKALREASEKFRAEGIEVVHVHDLVSKP